MNQSYLIKFLTTYGKFNNENIQLYDLNIIYNYFSKNYSDIPILNCSKGEKLFKIKFDPFGVDKFRLKRKMLENFEMEITYSLI
jgi:hypothetical protein